MKIKAKAKINLSLNVVGLSNGYHDLESVVTEIDLSDKLTAKKSDKIIIDYGKSFSISPEKDNAYKACKAFCETFSTGGAIIKIKKKIPAKAGLGGSSADAVGALKAMQKLYKIDYCPQIDNILKSVGSDCPVQYAGGYNLMKGRGEVLTKINSTKTLYFVLICETSGVDTAECFALCDQMQVEQSNNTQLIDYLGGKGQMPPLKNALYNPATILNIAVKQNYELLQNYFDRVNMTGSGSAVYGVTQNKSHAKAVYKKLKRQGKSVIFTHN